MRTHAWKLKSRTLEWAERPLVMGILNVTPDSFSDGGTYLDPEAALDRALELEAEGANLLDLGGESTRPGATLVTAETELGRILPVLRKLQGKLGIPLSIDTWKAPVAAAALGEGAEIINDVSAGRWDAALWPVVAQHGAGYVLMHALDRPATMQDAPQYMDPAVEIVDFLGKFLARAEENGLALESMGRPLLVGLSRKSFLNLVGGSERTEYTSQWAHMWATAQGAAIWRVHDVPAATRAARVAGAFGRGSPAA
jgi:dihydropteroate synthase